MLPYAMAAAMFLQAGTTSSPPQTQAKTVTYRNFGAGLPSILADLSQSTGLQLTAATAMKSEILCISVKSAPVTEFLKRVAQVTDAEWQKTSTGFVLVPSELLRTRRQNAQLDRDAMRIDKWFKERLAPPKSRAEGEAATDIGTTIIPLLQAVGARQIAEVGPNRRMVYSTQPTAMQLPLDGSVWELLKPMTNQVETTPDGTPLDDIPESPARRPNGPPTKALLIISNQMQGGIMGNRQCTVKLYNRQGGLIRQQSLLVAPVDNFLSSGLAGRASTNSVSPANENLITLGIDAANFAAYVQNLENSFSGKPAPANVKDKIAAAQLRLKRPDLNEPLAILGDPFVQSAEAKGKQLIALVPDSIFMQGVSEIIKPIRPTAFLQGLKDSGLEFTDADGWLTAVPFAAQEARRTRDDRILLAQIAKLSDQLASPSFNLLLDLASAGVDIQEMRLSTMIGILTQPALMGSMFRQDWKMLKLYASLGPDQRQQLEEGKSLQFSTLNGSARDAIADELYNRETSLMTGTAPGTGTDTGFGMPGMFGAQVPLGTVLNDLSAEPTESAPNGLPSGGYLAAQYQNEEAYFPVQDKPTTGLDLMFGGGMTIQELASLSAMSSGASPMSGMGMSPITHVRVGHRTDIALKFFITPTVYFGGRLSANAIDPTAPSLALNQLPTKVYEQYVTLRDQLVKQMKQGSPAVAAPDTSGAPPDKP